MVGMPTLLPRTDIDLPANDKSISLFVDCHSQMALIIDSIQGLS